jgi:predicted transcriptional regulator YheO
VHTDRGGTFSIHLALGTYTLHGITASGVKCRSGTVKIRNSAGESLTLICI